MPHPRAVSIVLCSCGWRIGNSARAAACEEMEAAEHALIATYIPRLIRHHQLGHRFTLGDNAPREFLATIARAAAAAKGEGGDGDVEAEPGRLRLTAVED